MIKHLGKIPCNKGQCLGVVNAIRQDRKSCPKTPELNRDLACSSTGAALVALKGVVKSRCDGTVSEPELNVEMIRSKRASTQNVRLDTSRVIGERAPPD